MKRQKKVGFTMAELLIALGILGVIATFSIPKIMVSQQNISYKAAAKEVAGMVSSAYDQYKLSGQLTTNTTMGALTPYMNYATTTSTLLDFQYGTSTSQSCASATFQCLKLHNGGVFMYTVDRKFNGTNLNNGLPFYYDPDRAYTSTTNAPGKAIQMTLYYNGKVLDIGNAVTNTQNNIDTYSALPSGVPPWFDWN